MIAIDFETRLISEQEPVPKPICLSTYDGKIGLLHVGEDIHRQLLLLLNSNEIILVHNISFESLIIHYYYPDLRLKLQEKLENGTIICTLIYEQLIDCLREKPILKYSLDSLVKKYFNTDISESKKDTNSWRFRYHELEKAENWPIEAIDYAIADSIWTYKLYDNQKIFNLDYKVHTQAAYYLNLMGIYGMEIDLNRVKLTEQELLAKKDPIIVFLKEQGFVKSNGKKQIKKFREYVQSLPLFFYYTKTNKISVSSMDLIKYYTQLPDPIIKAFLDLSKYEKTITAFISRLKGNTIIRTNYNALVSTGRTSSRTSSNYPSVNIQQMPRKVEGTTYDIRNCFKAREGFKLVTIDYSTLELCSTASRLLELGLNGDMLSTINKGLEPVDLHSYFAAKVKSRKDKSICTYDEFISRKSQKEYKEIRQLCKPISLGFPGGIGFDVIYNILLKEGIKLHFKILKIYKYTPDTLDHLNKIIGSMRKDGFAVRTKRVSKTELAVVEDELVELKQILMDTYPDLKEFLAEWHLKSQIPNKFKYVLNEFKEFEKEPYYNYNIGGFQRNYCLYTEFCNGTLMQTPSAIGAKHVINAIGKKYNDYQSVRPLAFIHDELIYEIKDDIYLWKNINDIGDIMITEMQKIIKTRITIEISVMTYWSKSNIEDSKVLWKNIDNPKLMSYTI